MTRGNVIFLNGASSSGKTTIAKTLQQVLQEPYLLVAVDSFVSMLPEHYLSGEAPLSEKEQAALAQIVPKLVSGMHHCIPTLASAGINLIVDHVLQEQKWLKECVTLLADFPILFVGVRCPLEELERRERDRKREPGTARYQFDRVHAHGIYDLEVDTSSTGALECAYLIQEALSQPPAPRAFKRIQVRLAGG